MNSPATTVCVLLYGDYPKLAERCMAPLFKLYEAGLIQLRIGMNECGQTTNEQVSKGWMAATNDNNKDNLRVVRSAANLKKYPMMRKLIHGDEILDPISSPLTMWMDDDSRIVSEYSAAWLAEVESLFSANPPADMAGSKYTIGMGYRGGQPDWIASRSWYNGVPVRIGHKTPFATGGWWTTRTDILRKHDWPDPDILHRGGDVMLGELCRQHRYSLVQFNKGLEINQGESDKESGAKRRGYDEHPVGLDYKKESLP